MSGLPEEPGRRALLAPLRRASELVDGIDSAGLRPPWSDLIAALRSLPEQMDELDARLQGGELLEKQCDELMDRLRVTELALQNTSEAKDDAVLLLAEIREIATGETGGGSIHDVLGAVRRLREAAVKPRNPSDTGRGRSRGR